METLGEQIALPRYFFNLKSSCRVVCDATGFDLISDHAAHMHAYQVAREIMRNREPATRSWRIQVCDANRVPLFEVLFAKADENLSHLPVELREKIHDLCARSAYLNDTILDVRTSLHQLKGTIARSDRAPWLASLDGTAV